MSQGLPWSHEKEVARGAAIKAGAIILSHYAEFRSIPDAPADISTLADRQGQDAILETLASAFPDDGFIAEEDTPAYQALRHEGERVWVIDPIDGSRGFARKNDEFAIMIGLLVGGIPVLGVVLEPVRQRLTWAAVGQGCWWDMPGQEERLGHVSTVNELEQATLVQSRSKLEGGTAPVQPIGKVLHMYSAGIKLAMLARGEADLYVGLHPYHVWDLCAGHVLLQEAGGRLTDAQGEAVLYPPHGSMKVHGAVASNGLLHSAACAALPKGAI